MRAVSENEGYACGGCRRECLEAGVPAPCETAGGIDPETGLCPLGMPEIDPSNRLAIEIYGDTMAMGWEMTRDLHNLRLTDRERGNLLVRLRVLFDEAQTIRREKQEAANARNSANRRA